MQDKLTKKQRSEAARQMASLRKNPHLTFKDKDKASEAGAKGAANRWAKERVKRPLKDDETNNSPQAGKES